jgi:hypothetical protein
MSERSKDFDVMALESALRELRPRSDTLDRAVLMYRAGRASARSWAWPMATLFSTALSLVLGISLWMRPAPPVVYVAIPPARNDEVSVSPPSSPHANDAVSGAWSSYLELHEQVFRDGLDGLPAPPSTPEETPSLESLLQSLQ